jgi:hypothetical protein
MERMRGEARRHGGSNGSAAGTTSMGDGFAMLQRSFRVVHRIKKPSEEELQHSASWRDRAPFVSRYPSSFLRVWKKRRDSFASPLNAETQ